MLPGTILRAHSTHHGRGTRYRTRRGDPVGTEGASVAIVDLDESRASASARGLPLVGDAQAIGIGAHLRGAFLIARAGLLYDRSASTSWLYAGRLSELSPTTSVVADHLGSTMRLAAGDGQRPDGAWHVEWATLRTLGRRTAAAIVASDAPGSDASRL